MKVFRKSIELSSESGRPAFYTVTENAKQALLESGIKDGFCVVYSHHTTCSVMVQEASFDKTFTDLEYLQQDLVDVFENIIPTCRKEGQYMHPGPQLVEFSAKYGESKPETLNTDAHLRSALLGRSETIPVFDGKLDLGSFGHIYFVDFDQTRPRTRSCEIQIIGE